MSKGDLEKKAKAIMKIIELAESIGWRSLAIAKDAERPDPEGILLGASEFIDGFKNEMEQSINEEITDEFLKLESDSSDDEDDGSGDTFH